VSVSKYVFSPRLDVKNAAKEISVSGSGSFHLTFVVGTTAWIDVSGLKVGAPN
jgi:hypothetical protein